MQKARNMALFRIELYFNIKIQPLSFKSPIFSEILVSKKNTDNVLYRRVYRVRIKNTAQKNEVFY